MMIASIAAFLGYTVQMDIEAEVRALLGTTRVGMLATLGPDGPLASAIPFVALEGWQTLGIHVSTLAAHTQRLRHDPRVSVLVLEADQPQHNPLALKRLVLQGRASIVSSDHPQHDLITAGFLARFPDARITLGLGDFQFWTLSMHRALFIAADSLQDCSSSSASLPL